jgi:hypothetical protein
MYLAAIVTAPAVVFLMTSTISTFFVGGIASRKINHHKNMCYSTWDSTVVMSSVSMAM